MNVIFLPQKNMERKHLKATKAGKNNRKSIRQEFPYFEDKAQERIVKVGKKVRDLRKFAYPNFSQ